MGQLLEKLLSTLHGFRKVKFFCFLLRVCLENTRCPDFVCSDTVWLSAPPSVTRAGHAGMLGLLRMPFSRCFHTLS